MASVVIRITDLPAPPKDQVKVQVQYMDVVEGQLFTPAMHLAKGIVRGAEQALGISSEEITDH